MKQILLKRPDRARYLILPILLISLLMPGSISTAAPTIEVVVEDPTLDPAYTTCPDTYWYPFTNDRGHTTYLTLNVENPTYSENNAIWKPLISQTGYYQVEAYIAAHDPITWCTGTGRTIGQDTTDAHYTIHSAKGTFAVARSQYPLSNAWLNLGEYYFIEGQAGFVALTDLNSELDYTTTISFSAMRFTYTRATRPETFLPLVSYFEHSDPLPPEVGIIQAQGFDVCTLPSISTMQTWWTNSPYSFYGLYLGGVQLPAQCAVATASWVKAVHQQGWSFIPTWVGPQAPCSGYSHEMSSDPAVSYQQGRQEADSASIKAASLGLTNNGLGGTIIYYDMEVYGGATLACRQAAASFMNGWVERLGELGNFAGGYGAYNSYVRDWATVAHVPEDVWAASWYADYFDPYASVNTIPWLEGLWTNHQRIRQYAGDHHESWGEIGMAIDSDVADGMAAMPPSGNLAEITVTSSPPIGDAGWLSPSQGWLVSGGHLYLTSDRGQSWQDISPDFTYIASFLATGEAWAISSTSGGQLGLYHSTDFGASWSRQELPLPEFEWQPRQVQFSTSTSGWITLQKETSPAFSRAILLKTSDGGQTWDSADLPIMGSVLYSTAQQGWLMDSEQQQLFQSSDGGLTWQPARLSDYPRAEPALPDGTGLSGWQTDYLGWAVTSTGACQGQKGEAGFSCQVDHDLWQTLDGGSTWHRIPVPPRPAIKQ